jgi:hypothetical protein
VVRDALNGKPQAGVEVSYMCEGNPNKSILNGPENSALTNNEGIADVSFSCREAGRVEIYVIAPNNKEECGSLRPLTLQEIKSTGFISDPTAAGNIWCPTKISRKMKPVPGEVLIFVKKPTWYQAHVAG